MDYEKKYNEALERARALWQEAIEKEYANDYIKDYETIFPELRESEDEKFRKYILRGCKECVEANDRGLELSMDTTKKLLSFLDTLEEPDRPEPYTGKYDEAYLNEKIKKASEHWRGVDVDKMLAECRGYDEEPVCEELEEYASRAGFDYVDDIEAEEPGYRWNDHDVEYAYRDGIIAGAKWQKEQFEKNRLAACSNQTKEEYDRETNFAIEIINKEHRQPTFSDAINYGMRLQKEQDTREMVMSDGSYFQKCYELGKKDMKEQMMKEAVECETVCIKGRLLAVLPMKEFRWTVGDKVRVIILPKEDEK